MQQRAKHDTGAPEECAQQHRRVHPDGRSLVLLVAVPEERGGGGRSEPRQHPCSDDTTLHLPSPHQWQVVMVTAFTVASIGLASLGTAESLSAAQTELQGTLIGQVVRTSSGSCGLPQS